MADMRILHFIQDQFFMPRLISTFRRLGTSSHFVCLYLGEPTRKCISEADGVTFIEVGSSEYQALIKEPNYDVVWIHPMTLESAGFVSQLKDARIVVIWSSWGADLYGLLNNRVLGWRTTIKWCCSVSPIRIVKALVRHLFAEVGLRKLLWRPVCRKLVPRIDFFSTVIENEGVLARKFLPRKVRQVAFHYADIARKDNLSQLRASTDCRNIWIGNSATFINNYFDVFPMLESYRDCHIYSSLSYGVEGDLVDKEGRRCFGERWHPYFDFVEFDTYRKRMAKCAVFVFGHYRQGAVGNIFIALKMGGCVFLSTKNPVYHFLINNGLRVYPLSVLKKCFVQTFNSFIPYRMDNIRKANQLRSASSIEKDLRNTIEILETEVMRRRKSYGTPQ